MLTRTQKEEQVAELKDKFSRATCVYVADYRGVDVTMVNELRGRIHKEGAGEYRVYRRVDTGNLTLWRQGLADEAVAEEIVLEDGALRAGRPGHRAGRDRDPGDAAVARRAPGQADRPAPGARHEDRTARIGAWCTACPRAERARKSRSLTPRARGPARTTPAAWRVNEKRIQRYG